MSANRNANPPVGRLGNLSGCGTSSHIARGPLHYRIRGNGLGSRSTTKTSSLQCTSSSLFGVWNDSFGHVFLDLCGLVCVGSLHMRFGFLLLCICHHFTTNIETKREEVESKSKETLVVDQKWTTGAVSRTATLDTSSPWFSSLTRPLTAEQNHFRLETSHDGTQEIESSDLEQCSSTEESRLEMWKLQDYERQECRLLSRMWRSLGSSNGSATTSARPFLAMELGRGITTLEETWTPKAIQKHLSETKKQTQGKGQGQRQRSAYPTFTIPSISKLSSSRSSCPDNAFGTVESKYGSSTTSSTSTGQPRDGPGASRSICWKGYPSRCAGSAQQSKSGWRQEDVQQDHRQCHSSPEDSEGFSCTDLGGHQEASSRMDRAPERQLQAMGRALGHLQEAASSLLCPSSPSSSGHGNSEGCLGGTEQGCCSNQPHGRGASRCRAGPRSRGRETSSTAGEDSTGMSCIDWSSVPRDDPSRFLRSGRREGRWSSKASSWRNIMTIGCALVCPRKIAHEPTKRVTWHADLVEAYESGWDWPPHAASQQAPWQPILHSVAQEADYLSPWQAQARALALHFEVVSDAAAEWSNNIDLMFPSLMKRSSKSTMQSYGQQPDETWRLFPPQDPFGPVCNGSESLEFLHRVPQPQPVDPNPQPLGAFDTWVRELWLTLGRFGTTTRDGHGFTVPIATWFLHSWTDRRCTRPRIFHLDDNPERWMDDLLRLWNDRIAPDWSVAFHLVQPNPPRSEDELVFGHLILAQAGFDDYSILSTSIFEGPMIRHHHRAALMPRIIRPHEIIDVSGTQPQCDNRAELGAPCIVRLRDEVLHNDNDYETCNGASFVIHIPLPTTADHDEDVFSSMAMQPTLHPPQAAVVDMPDAAQQDDEVEDPPTEVELPNHPDDEPPEYSPDDEGQSTFLFQLDYDPHHVRLPDHGIERAIRQALNWRRNDLRSWHPLHHIPEDLAATSTAGIIVHQQGDIPTGSTHQLVLVDVIFFSNDPVAETEVDRTVRLLPQYLTKRALFTSLGLQPFCDELQDYQCVLWHNAQGIQVDNFVIKTVHGDYIRIWIPPLTKSCQIPTRFVAKCLQQGHARHQLHNIYMEHMEDVTGSIDPRRIPSVDPHMRRTDDMSLLQHPRLTVRPKTTLQLQTLIPETTMMISCDRVLFLRQQCMALPQSQVFTRHSVVKWHDSTLAAFETVPEWTTEYPTALRFFTDGTSSRINGCWQGASAIVLVVSTTEGDRFGGFRCYSDDETMTAPRAELSAMLGAVAWACELLQGFDTSPPVSFNYDSLLAGNCANGLWTLHCHPDISGPLRAMVHWMLQCYGPIFSWAHVRAHEGHAWNEAADAVAWACQFGWIPRQPLKDLLDILTFDRTDFKTVEWLWFIEASLQHCPEVPRLHGRSLRVNLAAPFQKMPDDSIHSLMHATDQPAISTMPCRLTLRCVTANVLTLYGMKRNDTEATYGSCISARQEALLQLCHAQQMHLVGIQETRSRLAGYASCEHYHILAAPSTSRGVGGVQLWVAKVWASTPHPVHISADDLKIVHSSSQRLVVRLRHHDLKFFILVGHAPNNAEPQVLRDWWNGCTTACPTTLRTWPMIALLDANARLGSVVSNSVGSFQPQTENAAGEAFHQWLADEDLVVPQTFEQIHTGPGHTWTHASGATARLDYVAISQCLTDQCAVRTQIADLDLSISKQDHNAVQLEVDIEFSAPLQRAQTDIPHLPWNFDWDTDVHTHAAYLQNFVQCHYRQERPRLRPHRAHMTDSTWQLVLAKKYHWRRQRDLRRTLKIGQLRAVFSAWARRVPSHDCAPWLRVTHQALALHEHRQCSSQWWSLLLWATCYPSWWCSRWRTPQFLEASQSCATSSTTKETQQPQARWPWLSWACPTLLLFGSWRGHWLLDPSPWVFLPTAWANSRGSFVCRTDFISYKTGTGTTLPKGEER